VLAWAGHILLLHDALYSQVNVRAKFLVVWGGHLTQ
jgi:hypothetical protein